MIASPPEEGWAQPTRRLHLPPPPSGAVNLNVDGRRLNGALQGFGQLWQRTYRVALNTPDLAPRDVISAWKSHFGEFWPTGNRFFGSLPERSPGEVALLNLSPVPGPTISTGVMVIYADETSFTFMAPEGHMYAGWITFSSFVEDDALYAQVQVLIRTSDPAWELAMRLFAFKFEDAFWHATLANLAKFFNVMEASVEQRVVLLDPKLQWKKALNTWRNAAMWSGLYFATSPVRWVARRVSGGRSAVHLPARQGRGRTTRPA
jgi:hypothetical protein